MGLTVADFWGWSRSDLLDNTERGVLAEFIVAAALGIPGDGVREGWAAWDLTTLAGVRVEVKSAAYLQSWAQKGLSRISFGTPRTLAWDADGGGFTGAARRHSQVYVFALLAELAGKFKAAAGQYVPGRSRLLRRRRLTHMPN